MTEGRNGEGAAADLGTTAGLRGLVVDWGGVLTVGLREVVQTWAEQEDVDLERYIEVLVRWLGPDARLEAEVNPIHALERGEMAIPDFEQRFAEALQTEDGPQLRSEGLVQRMFTYLEHAPAMNALVRRAHKSGIRTALLSNSWGNTYPREGWDEMFDEVVISGEVGLRKPDADIYRLVCDRLGLRPDECVFVDDLVANVAAAVALGFVGVHHTSYETTAGELQVLFGRDLS